VRRGVATASGDDAFHARASFHQRFHFNTRADFRAARDGRGQHSFRERAAIERAFFRQKRSGLRVARNRRLDLMCFVERQRLDRQTEAVMERDERAEFALGVSGKENLHRAGFA